MTAATHTITDRRHFTVLLREYRAQGIIRSYGRLAGFGRSINLTDGTRFIFDGWVAKPTLNLHW